MTQDVWMHGTIVSIHAPVKGATVTQDVWMHGTIVSIHAPVKGATAIFIEERAKIEVSIHAPVKGATFCNTPRLCLCRCFNPRPREGGDQYLVSNL